MKINPVGIQSYQQLTSHQRNTQVPKENVGNSDSSLTISSKEITNRSDVAVKAPEGNYSDFLSSEEKSALDMLFHRYADTGRFGSSFNKNVDSSNNEEPLGRVIDVKV
ncbi:MAG: hypothetical protein U9N55_02330 [candidate division Zixibacteria bacterium]|nr:hypothetical protein [candidate division Zixibacteria bacterium]